MKTRRTPKEFWAFYDESCSLCQKVAGILEKEETYVPLRFLPMAESSKKPEFHTIAPHVASGKFVGLDDEGNIYLDTNARIMVLYLTKRYRALSYTLSAPGVSHLVNIAFGFIANNRKGLSRFISNDSCKSGNCSS